MKLFFGKSMQNVLEFYMQKSVRTLFRSLVADNIAYSNVSDYDCDCHVIAIAIAIVIMIIV